MHIFRIYRHHTLQLCIWFPLDRFDPNLVKAQAQLRAALAPTLTFFPQLANSSSTVAGYGKVPVSFLEKISPLTSFS